MSFRFAWLRVSDALSFLPPRLGLRFGLNVPNLIYFHLLFFFTHFADAFSAFSRCVLAHAPASPACSARDLRATGPCNLDRSWTFHRLILIDTVLLGGIRVAPLSSLLVLSFTQSFSHYYLYIHFSAALVLSCSLGRKCSCIWQVLEVGFPGFSHFGKKRCKQGIPTSEKKKCKKSQIL